MESLKILMISNLCPPDYDGGFELRAFQVAQALRERGHRVDLATNQYRPHFKGERKDPSWVHRIFRFVTVSRSTSAWRYVDRIPRRIACSIVASENIPAMKNFLAGRDYDLAYLFGLQRLSLATAAPLMQRDIPILWHAGDNYIADHFYHWPKTLFGYSSGLNLFAKRWYELEKRIDFRSVAFVSEFLRDEASQKGFRPQKTFIIPRGFDGPLGWDVDRPKADPPLFFMACRIDDPRKGVHEAIKAAARLRTRRPDLNWSLEIAGRSFSGHRNFLERLAQNLNLTERVSFLGQIPRSEVLAKMRQAVAFLSCSTYGEPFAGTIIEALATGTVLIGSRAGSILEVATPGISALIYEIGDIAALSRHMERIITDSGLRNQLATGGVQVIERRYTLDRVLDQTEAIFSEVINDYQPMHAELSFV
jgi:glycosyltransferase involved in cell wall biosynthesis